MEQLKTSSNYSDNFHRLFPIIMSAKIRSKNTDFIVNEVPAVTPIGTGEHVWLKIRKSGENTDWVAGLLARIAKVNRKDVSYAGMKDRNAITTQWFSIYLPGKISEANTPNWQDELPDNVEILEETRHERKLRRGTLKGNQFQITLRECEYLNHADIETLEERINAIREKGIPNYFGSQRFGRDFYNLYKAESWFTGKFRPKKRNLQGLYLSSARSWIFNQILSKRVKQQTWDTAVDGDVFMLEGSHSWFTEPLSDDIKQRVNAKELHPTGALWGQGELASQHTVNTLEESIGKTYQHLSQGLCDNKLKQERRNLRLPVNDLTYKIHNGEKIVLNFYLPSGTYATSVLRELIDFKQ